MEKLTLNPENNRDPLKEAIAEEHRKWGHEIRRLLKAVSMLVLGSVFAFVVLSVIAAATHQPPPEFDPRLWGALSALWGSTLFFARAHIRAARK